MNRTTSKPRIIRSSQLVNILSMLRRAGIAASTVMAIVVSGQGNATQLSIATSPLFLSVPVAPNVFFLADDSGSMDWTMMVGEDDGVMHLTAGGNTRAFNYLFPGTDNNYTWDSTNGRRLPSEEGVLATANMPADAHGVWRGRYHGYNGMYYNPDITYRPWTGVDNAGNTLLDASPTAARRNPYDAAIGTLDLTATLSWASNGIPNTAGGYTDVNNSFYTALYYTWTDSDSDGVVDAGDAHARIEIRGATDTSCTANTSALTTATTCPADFTRASTRTDCAAVNTDQTRTCTRTEELGNFANWYSYYRRRMHTAKAAIGRVIAPSSARMGYATLHNNNSVDTLVALMNSSTNSGNKRTLLDQLYKSDPASGTPLRTALDETGKYFECVSGNIFGLAASSSSCPILPAASGGNCQQNFTVLMTDGYYNDSYSGLGNVDADGSSPNGAGNTSFDGGAYADTYSNTLGDVAMHYYERDLSTALANNVSVVAGVDNATHQHMVTYTVAFGVNGTLSANPTDPSASFTWPDPTAGDSQKIDDLRHAAYNGRGKFLSAGNPNSLITALSDAIGSIEERTGSASSVAVNSRSLSSDTRIYQARFTSSEWSGDLRALAINSSGAIGTEVWSSKTQLNGQNWDSGRAIITRSNLAALTRADGATCTAAGSGTNQGVPFRWANLTSPLQCALNFNTATSVADTQGSARLNWLRGDSSNEGTNNNYRIRSGFKLGDIVNSSPIFIGPPPYLADIEDTAHSAFRDTYGGRKNMIYVGANDGMLHGFDADTGQEKMAYVPTMLFPNLAKLTDTSYAHRYYVDGSPTAADTYGTFASGCSSTACWRTVLASGLGAGGKGVFALDVTDPTGIVNSALAFTETNAGNTALWEYTDTSAPNDMGYVLGHPVIARVRTSSTTTAWAVIFGNGYNSVDEKAILYVVNAVTGAQIAKINLTGATTGTSNGLSAPAVVDVNSDYVADYAYAGDLLGNMWKIDLTSNSPGSWGSYYTKSSNPAPLFKATDGTTTTTIAQPITERPEVSAHPDGQSGYMVYFGTGRYLADGDKTPSATPVQSFYGVWDKGGSGSVTGSATAAVSRTRLLPQVISNITIDSVVYRTITDRKLGSAGTEGQPQSWGDSGSACDTTSSGNCMGWYSNLPTTGEMSVSNPILRGGTPARVIYTTLIPESSACSYGGSSWLMEQDPINGGRFSSDVFGITSTTSGGNEILVVGKNPQIGIMPEPTIIRDPANSRDLKIVTGSTGAVESITNTISKDPGGRQSWRQLK